MGKIRIILGDIRDFDSVYKSMQGSNICIHLAALIGIPYSYISPLAYLKTNVEGTYNILESAKNLKIKKIIITSTSEVYGSAQYLPINEEHPLVGQSPYSASKISADQLAISYIKSYNTPITIVRPFNVFGPRQSLRAVIPTIISQILFTKNGEIKLGNLNTYRDFTFVYDTVEAFISILNTKKTLNKIINVGMNNMISVQELVALIAKKIKKPIKIIKEKDRIRPGGSELTHLNCDNTKILQLTNWKPKIKI